MCCLVMSPAECKISKRGGWMDAAFFLVRSHGQFIHPNWTPLVLVVAVLLCSRTDGIQVIGADQTVTAGATVVLPCAVTDTKESITQISWQMRVQSKPQSDNFFTVLIKNGHEFVGEDKRFSFAGNVKEKNGSLQLSNTKLSDEAIFVCIFTMFPSGNFRTEINLTVLVPPVISVEDDRPTLENDKEVLLATCTAAGSKPPAEVKWITDNVKESLNSTSEVIRHENGTTTTTSSLFGIPTRDLANQEVQCVVTSAAKEPETRSLVLQVYFAPLNTVISEKEDHSFECQAEGYPKPLFNWLRADGATVQALSPVLNKAAQPGLYRCEAFNSQGTQQIYLSVTTRQGKCCGACCTVLGILIFVIVVAVGYKLYRHGGWHLRRSESPPPGSPSGELETRRPLPHGEEDEE